MAQIRRMQQMQQIVMYVWMDQLQL